ncbi:protein of unknown function [Aquimarina amphilecti]|uniref:DUF4252 domain-containing protein n=1 Tax=Aquimarina amphilecti TaxID=1038014 RepID=A0A1H7WSR5_AQUAM|nr:DUF4252 domain-containing protein [Aquimarina amphilecti]SEM23947.1 protein of unknown function [Aquimarina amphilecti]
MKNIIKLTLAICGMLFISCNSETSLQRYFVDHQSDADFVAVDLATSLLDARTKKVNLSDDEREALESIKKVNFLAMPLKEGTKTRYEEEKAKINTILDANKYETLMRFGSNGTKAVLKFQGEEDNIDEMIVFASNGERGLALVRVLGDDMKPGNVAKLMNAIDKGDVDIGAIKDILGDVKID